MSNTRLAGLDYLKKITDKNLHNVFHNIEEAINSNYNIVYADPPWSYYGDPNKDQAAGKHYKLMSDNEIWSMPVRKICSEKAVLFLWATSPRLDAAIETVKRWGFHYRGIAWVWVKTTNAGKIINGQGVRPSFVKPTVELVLVGSTEKKGRTFPLLTESMPNVILAARPNNKHSKKPEIFRQMITDLLGDRKRIELFARNSAPGWDLFGNEV